MFQQTPWRDRILPWRRGPAVQNATLAPAPRPFVDASAPRLDGVALFHLRTGRGNWLACSGVRACMTETEDATRLIAAIPDANRQLVFLMARDLRPIEIQSDGMRSVAVSAFAVQTDRPGIVRLKHPLSPRFLGVTRLGEGAAEGCVVFDSLGQTLLDAFQLIPAAQAGIGGAIPEQLRIAVLELAEAAARPFRAEKLLALIQAGVVRPSLAEALLRLLPPDELRRLAWRPEALRRAMPDDSWLSDVLPALAAWRCARTAIPGGILDSPAADERAGDPLEGFGQPQAGFALTCLARADVSPRRTACILAAARNEGPYLLEWIAYHRAVGFEHVFLYTNDNDDGSDQLLAALAQAGVITWIRNETGTHHGPQYKAYAHALTMLPQILDFRWTAILDLDEYFAFDTRMFSGVADFIGWQETQPVDAIALCWLVFAAGTAQSCTPGPSLQRFTRREAGVNPHVKTLFRTNRFWHAQAHFPYATLGAPFVFRNEAGALHHHPGVAGRIPAFAETPSANQAWINHYLLRTAPEALWKLARGLGDWPLPTAERQAEFTRFVCRSFLALGDAALVEDERIQACAPGQGAQLDWLLSLPGVAAAEARIQAGFMPRLANLTADFLATRMPDEAPALERFRDVLRRQG